MDHRQRMIKVRFNPQRSLFYSLFGCAWLFFALRHVCDDCPWHGMHRKKISMFWESHVMLGVVNHGKPYHCPRFGFGNVFFHVFLHISTKRVELGRWAMIFLVTLPHYSGSKIWNLWMPIYCILFEARWVELHRDIVQCFATCWVC